MDSGFDADLDARERRRFGRGLLIVAVGYLVFVVYGSLVPLNFQPLPLADAVTRFRSIAFLALDVQHRADWVANLLLFIPLSMLMYGGLTTSWPGRRAAAAFASLVLLAGAFLGIGIEFLQVYFPGRTVSLNDVYAQCLGAVLGLVAWRPARPYLETAYRHLRGERHEHSKLRIVLIGYAVVLFFYNVMPLDLTVSVAELHEKVKAGRVHLDPFRLGGGSRAAVAYELMTDAAIWVPVAVLLMIETGGRLARSVLAVLLAAAALEGVQLFVFSRVVDARDVLSALPGALLGALGARHWLNASSPGADAQAIRALGLAGSKRWMSGLAALAWTVALLAIFWYPYTFDLDGADAARRWMRMQNVPLAAYYTASEYQALTGAVRKIALFLPLGALLAAARIRQLPTAIVAVAVAVVVELGQVLIPDKIIDTGDLLFALLGALLGHGIVRPFLRPDDGSRPPARAPAPPRRGRRVRTRDVGVVASSYAGLVVVAALILGAAVDSPRVPYNVRELFEPATAGRSGALLAASAILLLAPAVWAARALADSGWSRVWVMPLTVLAGGALAFGCLSSGVPRESLYDIVGTPVLGWPSDLEMLMRFVALQAPLALAGALAVLLLLPDARGATRVGLLSRGAVVAAPLLWLAHAIVVDRAATDNLTELMARGGDWLASATLFVWLLVTVLAGHAVAASLVLRRASTVVAAVAALAVLAVAGRALLEAGLAASVEKYGQTFSALQFLLSPSRESLASGAELAARFGMLQFGVVAAVAVTVFPAWLAVPRAGASPRAAPARADGPVMHGTAPGGRYVPVALSDTELTFLRAQSARAGCTVADYLAGVTAEEWQARDPAAAQAAAPGMRLDVWLDISTLARMGKDARSAAGEVECIVLGLVRGRMNEMETGRGFS